MSQYRISQVHVPALLLIAGAMSSSPREEFFLPLGYALDQSARLAQRGDERLRALVRWARTHFSHALTGFNVLADAADAPMQTEASRKNALDILWGITNGDAVLNPPSTISRAAERLTRINREETRPETDPFVFVLESVRLFHAIGTQPMNANTCNRCAYMDAAIGPLDPVCPLCSAVERQAVIRPIFYRARALEGLVVTALLRSLDSGAQTSPNLFA